MLKCIVTYYECCKRVLLESQKTEKKISMALIEEAFNTTVINDLKEMKFIDPALPEREIVKKLDALAENCENEFRKLLHG